MTEQGSRSKVSAAKWTFRLAGLGGLALLCGISASCGETRSGVAGAAPAKSAAAPEAAKHAPQAWPANVHLVEAKLAPKEFEKPKFRLEVPQLRIYDRQGRLVYDQNGYDEGQAGETLRRALTAKPVPGKGEDPLANELKRFHSLEGKPLAVLPATDLRIVEWWAEWCVPCHAQAKELVEALGKTPQTKVALVHVDANPPGLRPKKIVFDESKLTPEMLEKLKDPNTPAAERQKIFEAAGAKVEGRKGEGAPPPRR